MTTGWMRRCRDWPLGHFHQHEQQPHRTREVFRDVVTDWGKLSEVALLTQATVGTRKWVRLAGTAMKGNVLNGMIPAFSQLFYAELMPTLYQRVFLRTCRSPIPTPTSTGTVASHGGSRSASARPISTSRRVTIIISLLNFRHLCGGDGGRTYPTAALMQSGLPTSGSVYLRICSRAWALVGCCRRCCRWAGTTT